MGGVVPKILIDAFFCGQGQLAIRVSSQAVFAKTGQRKNRRAGAFALSGNLQHLRCFAGIGNDHGKISLGQTTSLISLVVQIVGDNHPFSDLQHLFPEGLGLIDSSSGGKNVDFFVVFKKQHGFVQIFIPEKLHGVPDGFLVQLPDVLRYPHGTVGFRKGKIEVHLALPLVKIFQLAHKVLLEVVKAGKAQFFAKAQHGRRRGIGHFRQTAGGIFGNFHAMYQNISSQCLFAFRKFFLKCKFVHDQH